MSYMNDFSYKKFCRFGENAAAKAHNPFRKVLRRLFLR